MTVSEQPLVEPAGESRRVRHARDRAEARLRRERERFQPLGVAVVALVLITTAGGHPRPSGHGRGLVVSAALAVFVVAMALVTRSRFTDLRDGTQAAAIALLGTAGVALAAASPHGAAGVAASVAVFIAAARLPTSAGVALAGAVTAGLGVASAATGSSTAAVLAEVLLCVLVALVAHFLRQARIGQSRTEVLMAQLQDAQEEQARAAAINERGRIAGELHDVLAHALSGAAIQLQGARMLAEREGAGETLRSTIERAGELVRDGLVDARQAVSALRGEELPGVDQLDGLVATFRRSTDIDVGLQVLGRPRALRAETSLALFRAAQEGLTNVARYAPGHAAAVTLAYEEEGTRLRVENRPVPGAAAGPGLAGVGGGHGLTGARERVQRCGGTLTAGPTEDGWQVEVDVPE
ncbi:MAG TPA: histidine kinase [Solirubrobacteraceae bacterium]|nr:histidine kinase [Solirubrobacteraceae bacterium]